MKPTQHNCIFLIRKDRMQSVVHGQFRSGWNTPWKFNISSLKIGHPKRKGSSSKQHFSGASCWTSVAEVGRCMSGAQRVTWESLGEYENKMRNGITRLPRSSISGGFGLDSTVIQGDWTSQLTFVWGCLKGWKGHEIYSWRWNFMGHRNGMEWIFESFSWTHGLMPC